MEIDLRPGALNRYTPSRMKIIPSPPGDPRPRYRGTGFDRRPGAMTQIEAPKGHSWGFENGVLVARPGAWVKFAGLFPSG